MKHAPIISHRGGSGHRADGPHVHVVAELDTALPPWDRIGPAPVNSAGDGRTRPDSSPASLVGGGAWWRGRSAHVAVTRRHVIDETLPHPDESTVDASGLLRSRPIARPRDSMTDARSQPRYRAVMPLIGTPVFRGQARDDGRRGYRAVFVENSTGDGRKRPVRVRRPVMVGEHGGAGDPRTSQAPPQGK
jgi:hypothetical protein